MQEWRGEGGEGEGEGVVRAKARVLVLLLFRSTHMLIWGYPSEAELAATKLVPAPPPPLCSAC